MGKMSRIALLEQIKKLISGAFRISQTGGANPFGRFSQKSYMK